VADLDVCGRFVTSHVDVAGHCCCHLVLLLLQTTTDASLAARLTWQRWLRMASDVQPLTLGCSHLLCAFLLSSSSAAAAAAGND
jgi:hypothetical protein